MVYNLIPSLFWSAVNLIPIYIFCSNFMGLELIILFSIISLFPVFLFNTFLEKIQIGKTTKIYKDIGVPFINNFTQNGVFVNKLIRKKYPNHKVLPLNRQLFNKHFQQTFLFEKFHLMLFLFFTMTAVYAFSKNYFSWFLVLLITNLIYNMYPILLQQYLRIRMKAIQNFTSR